MSTIKSTVSLMIFLLMIGNIWGQTDLQRKHITSNYDIDKLKSMAEDFSIQYGMDKKNVLKYARDQNIDVIIEKADGGIKILKEVLADGTLIYVETLNTGSATTINTNQVQSGGSLGLSLTGRNLNFGIWDGGWVRSTHQELVSRVTNLDNPPTLSNHATHVSGTMVASGVDPDAQGMAYEATLSAYNFENDLAEMTLEAANGMLISNHSYGLSPSSIPESWFGAYLGFASLIDNIAYNAPYYLPVYAAGNSNGNPPPFNSSKNGYDLISGGNLAKNIICVANVQEVSTYNGPSSVNIWPTSSWGPTDDGRIKPDISAQGRLTYSCTSIDDDSYASFTGTSMAAPAVSGSVGLLQEHHYNMYNSFLKAASMRALVIHTAREAGPAPGPDYTFGWGLMDTAEAAKLITNKNFTTKIDENSLSDGNTFTLTVNAVDPNEPLVATIAWTDPAGTNQSPSNVDDPTPRLVNDLDIIIIESIFVDYDPWKLDPSQPDAAATRGDNLVDNVEKIEVENAVGTYTIEISHKGNLFNGAQEYTLIVSGIAEQDFTIKSLVSQQSQCPADAAEFDLIIESLDNFNGNVSLSVSGLPDTLNTSFSENPVSNNGDSVLVINNLTSVAPGDYPFTVTATSGGEMSTFDFNLNVKPADPLVAVSAISPIDNGELISLRTNLDWNPVDFATNYEVEISTDPNFDSLLFNLLTADTSVEIPIELDASQTYHWRVRPLSDCITGPYTTESFQTKALQCEPQTFALDTPIDILDDAAATYQSVISIPENLDVDALIEDINVNLDLSHTWLSELVISLTSPQGTTVVLLDSNCGGLDDMTVTFDDKGITPSCNQISPALSGTISPLESLSAFIGEDATGDWILTVQDKLSGEGGTINTFGLELCYEETLSMNSFDHFDIKIFPNPSSGLVNISVNQNVIREAKVMVYDLNGKVLEDIKLDFNYTQQPLDLMHLNKGIYFIKLQSREQFVVKKLILK